MPPLSDLSSPSADFEQLAQEHRVLLAHCGSVQARCSRLIAEQAAEIARLQGEILRLRAAVIMRDSLLSFAREVPSPTAPLPAPARWRDKAVLCVGQDSSGATVARQVVERAGGQFLRHSGEEGASSAALDASLVAADLVICQTGCISHDAYWRVQDHCQRTGKQCVLVEQPLALQALRQTEAGKAG